MPNRKRNPPLEPAPRSTPWVVLSGVGLLALSVLLLYQDLTLKRSVGALEARVQTLEKQAPGLGEYMTSMQLHMGKLWFAAKAGNWDLGGYEIGELKEAMEGAQGLHQMVNTIDTSTVIGSVESNQVQTMVQALQKRDLSGFQKVYGETLKSCNQCHEMTAHGFNVITVPTAPPVFNQLFRLKK
jgi:hypothetical protein